MDEKELKMKLLEKLMEEMDDGVVSKFKKPEAEEPMAAITEVETEEVPVADLEAKVKEKLSPEPEMEEEDEFADSRLMQKLKALKSKT